MAAPTTLRIVDPEAPEEHIASQEYDLDEGNTAVTYDENGVARIEHPDGSVTFDLAPKLSKKPVDDDDFFRNLADEIDNDTLNEMASDLLTGIELDIESRKDWLETRAAFIRMLALKLEEPRG